MGRTRIIFSALLLPALLLSCQKESAPEEPVDGTVFSASIQNVSKTVMDGLNVNWENDDVIIVNGQPSTSIAICDNPSSADFTLPQGLQAPFDAVSPASAWSDGKVVLPSVQNWREGSFDPAAALMLSTGGTTDLLFRHAMAYVKFTVAEGSGTDAISYMQVTANGNEALSGSFTPDYSAPALTAVETSASVRLDCAEGVPQGKDFIVAIPAQKYAQGITVRIVDVKNHYMDIVSTEEFDAVPGGLYPTSVTFAPKGTLINSGLDSPAPRELTKILFIGNSHDLDATQFLPDMLLEENVRSVELTRVYHGGYYLYGYDSNYSLANNCSVQTWSPGQNVWRGSIVQDHSLKSVVESDVYDIVVLQEYSASQYCWKSWSQLEKDSINGLFEKIRRTSPDARFFYFLSHCWADNYSGTQTYFQGSSVYQFNKCIENNLSHVMDHSEGFEFSGVISTAAYLESLRTSGLNVDNGKHLLRGDGVHLDYGMSRCGAALLLWKTLITPLTGIQAGDVSFRYTEYYPQDTKYNTPFTDENHETVMAAVDAAYANPDRITDLSSCTGVPAYVDVPASYGVAMKNVDVQPVTFPVKFIVGVRNNASLCNSETQPVWPSYGILSATQQQAAAKWVAVSKPVASTVYNRTFISSNPNYSFLIQGIWTGDYLEMIIPVKNFRAGSTLRVSAPVYQSDSPVSWALDYKDGEEWKTKDVTLGYGSNALSEDITFSEGLSSGFLRMRLRCKDGSVIATGSETTETVSMPHMNGGAFDGKFYLEGTGALQIDLVR